MPGDTLFSITVTLSVVVGTAATILALLTYEILRQSPLGRSVFLLTLALGVFLLYHVMVLAHVGDLFLAQFLKSAVFTGAAVFVWTMVVMERRWQRTIDEGTTNP